LVWHRAEVSCVADVSEENPASIMTSTLMMEAARSSEASKYRPFLQGVNTQKQAQYET
jgi:hypothetical protein